MGREARADTGVETTAAQRLRSNGGFRDFRYEKPIETVIFDKNSRKNGAFSLDR
jgi:hypothetical protein